MHDCVSTPPEEPPETKVFLEISEFKAGRDKALFTGWMFASSPGINAMEHPVLIFGCLPVRPKTVWCLLVKSAAGKRGPRRGFKPVINLSCQGIFPASEYHIRGAEIFIRQKFFEKRNGRLNAINGKSPKARLRRIKHASRCQHGQSACR